MMKVERAVSSVTETLFSIAGEAFRMSSTGVAMLPETDRAYDGFFQPFSSHDAACDIDVTVGDLQVPSHDSLLFETDELWKLYKKDDVYMFVLSRTLEQAEPYIIATYDVDAAKICITCSADCLRKDASSPLITNPIRYPLDQLLVNLHFALNRRGLLLHCAGAACEGKGVILCGKSGAGKTTIAKLLDEQGSVHLLSDDRVLIKDDVSDHHMWGTPWPGEGGFAANDSAELRGICFLEHGDKQVLTSITAQQALDRMLPVASIPWYDEEIMITTLDLVECLLERVPCHVLSFTPDRGAAELVESLILAG